MARRLLYEAGDFGGALADPAAAVRLARAEVSGQPVIASSAVLHAYVRAELAPLPRE